MSSSEGAAIVTGAAGGIGAALVRRLARAGMAVVAADIDAARLARVCAEVAAERPGAELEALEGDVGDPGHHLSLVEAARDLGGLRLSVLNAGVTVTGWSWELPLAEWERVVQVDYWGVVHGVRAALSEMIPVGDGQVVAVSSGAGLVATPGLAPYVSSKHAVVGLMESVHHELVRVGSRVRASVVCPGNVATPLPERTAMRAPGDPVLAELDATVRAGVAAGASPEAVADAVVEGVGAGRFWILPQPEVGWAAQDRVRRLVEGDLPVDLLG